jgi:hypothetical protein
MNVKLDVAEVEAFIGGNHRKVSAPVAAQQRLRVVVLREGELLVSVNGKEAFLANERPQQRSLGRTPRKCHLR